MDKLLLLAAIAFLIIGNVIYVKKTTPLVCKTTDSDLVFIAKLFASSIFAGLVNLILVVIFLKITGKLS